MQVSRTETGGFTLSALDSPLYELLLAIPDAARTHNDPAARKRLYPNASNEIAINEEWHEFVHPDLYDWFKSTTDIVRADLKKLEETGEGSTLTIEADNVEPWLNALNQARLSLAARHNVTEEDMEHPTAPELDDPRDLALFQIHFYGFLQECFVKGLESE